MPSRELHSQLQVIDRLFLAGLKNQLTLDVSTASIATVHCGRLLTSYVFLYAMALRE